VVFVKKTIYEVPHPFFLNANGLISNIREQIKFKHKIKKLIEYDSNKTYISCSTSSILIAIKEQVDHILLDEGMGSLIARHRPDKQGGNKYFDFLKEKIAEFILPFRFARNTRQITLTNDPHKSILANLDYRSFTSSALKNSLVRLISHTNSSSQNAIILVKAPTPSLKSHPKEGEKIGDQYIEFNVSLLEKYIQKFPLTKDSNFYLKLHPALGRNSIFLENLMERISKLGIKVFNICDFIDFEEATFIPVEAILKYTPIQHVLAFDISSTLWNVAHWKEVNCYCPLEDAIQFSKIESPEHQRLYFMQRTIDTLLGNNVLFY
ncbi:hypothetical protein, partial [Leptospira ognonensis]|uniref:hypothetical protein n=1 Tax=Leptospira ognonensis TaxID=2484945 RepID=UPI001AEFA761